MADYGHPETYTANRTNGLGLAGFITSLVGLVSCGLISPIGFLMSFFGLFKSPRGFALAGFVLGGLGSLWILFVTAIAGIIIGLPILAGIRIPEVSTPIRILVGSGIVEEYKAEHGRLPDLAEWEKLVESSWITMTDGWDQAFQYTLDENGLFEIRSAGPDGEFGTEDDITSDEIIMEVEHDHGHAHDGHDHDHGEHNDHGDGGEHDHGGHDHGDHDHESHGDSAH